MAGLGIQEKKLTELPRSTALASSFKAYPFLLTDASHLGSKPSYEARALREPTTVPNFPLAWENPTQVREIVFPPSKNHSVLDISNPGGSSGGG